MSDLLSPTQRGNTWENIMEERLRIGNIYSIDFVARILVHFVELLQLFYYYIFQMFK